MKVNFNTVLTDLKGRPIKEGEDAVTLGMAACNALLTPFPDEQSLGGAEKMKRYKIATKITDANGEAVDLSAEDITELKKLVGKAYAPLVVGRAFELLDPGSDT